MGKSKTIFLGDDRLLLIQAITSIDPNIEIVETENGQELLAPLAYKQIPDRSKTITSKADLKRVT